MNHHMTNPLKQGSTIGILGGGQLGRMLAIAASKLGFKTHIYEPGKNPPASQVANKVTTAAYEDTNALIMFANEVDVITFEFENIPETALNTLETTREVLPARNALATSQDRITEKKFLEKLGLKVAPYANINTQTDLLSALATVGAPSIMKTRRFGYDGKGQVRLKEVDDGYTAWEELGKTPCVLEGLIDFKKEVSVIGARNQSGEVVCFDPGENIHKNGILHTTNVPADITSSQRMDAVLLTGKILNALDYVGVMGIELFVTADELLINEIAPRVHNSGHWTQNGCVIDQFEQHIRAISGWHLGNGKRHSNVLMTNLIGAEVLEADTLSKDTSIGIHLYGKEIVKPGRKMGHINKILANN